MKIALLVSEGPYTHPARDKAREEARARLEEQVAKTKEPVKPLPEFGSAEDFPLQQALNQLRGLPVMASKNVERRAEAPATSTTK